jgi:predicted nucleic acid-binding protein
MTTARMGRRKRLSWFRDYLPEGQLILDASVIINLLGCGAASDVFSALPLPCLVEEKVLGEISRHPIPGLCHAKGLQALEASGFIVRTKMNDDEYGRFLSLVQAPLGQRLDAGESATLVVAQGRALSVVIDENKARSYVSSCFPEVATVSTLRLFISATFRLGHDVAFLQSLLGLARSHARMGVPKDEKSLLNDVLRAGAVEP